MLKNTSEIIEDCRKLLKIPGDIYQTECISDRQRHPLCLRKISFWEANVASNWEYLLDVDAIAQNSCI